MDILVQAVERFFIEVDGQDMTFCNEAELQHELGWWLRATLPQGSKLFFERPAGSFFEREYCKKEIDLVVAPPARDWHAAIELKCPRNGRHPETMFDACRDLQFLEQLVDAGFVGGLFVMHVADPRFYRSGSQAGIYSYFRAGTPLSATISKPTGSKDDIVNLRGSYRVGWRACGKEGQYWLQVVTPRFEVTKVLTDELVSENRVLPKARRRRGYA